MTDAQQKTAAKKFAEYWQGKGYEKGESQPFWLSLLRDVYGVEEPEKHISFEDQVKLDKAGGFIDGYISATHTMIEQKGSSKDLNKPIKQSDGSSLTPFQQAKRYSSELPYSQRPRWIIACNFREFQIYDMEQPNATPEVLRLEDLPKEYYRLSFLVEKDNVHLQQEEEISFQAGKLVGVLYDALAKQYGDLEDPFISRSLNVLCVRLVFCLYAEDAGIFGKHLMFHDYLSRYSADEMREALLRLFDVLDTDYPKRSKYLNPVLSAFPYVNGGLFADRKAEIPLFTEEIKTILLDKASVGFDWSEISPTIFGAVFESTLNPDTRRKGGMHYTSIQNIHKVIDPLFLDALQDEYKEISEIPNFKTKSVRLEAFQDKLASLQFLDPACGSGNFLTETYISLRRLENKVISALHQNQVVMGDALDPIKVSISQFHGIEINDFAETVAKTALWIAESQMMKATEEIVEMNLDFLPLKTNANIVEGNALRVNWEDIVSPDTLNYIMGNPPFVGYAYQTKEQKDDLALVCPACGKNIDYVAGWYFKTARLMERYPIRAALVSTNSITQGEQVSAIWRPLIEKHGIQIDFAHRTFRWDNEANLKAQVHCVIVGFSNPATTQKHQKYLYDGAKVRIADNISPYLIDAPNTYVERRSDPICDVPTFVRGCQPTDDSNFILTAEEKDALLQREPQAEMFIRPYMMGKDFIQRVPRYCIWLDGANPADLKKCPLILERLEKVREFRLKSTKSATRAKADTPSLFDEIREPKTDYVALPKVSSEGRRYIPIDYLPQSIIPGDKLFCMQNSTLYHFGILTSNIHMAWMRAVCGRLKSDYSYSNTIVYNNFPWPTPSEAQRAKIEQTAQEILDARAKYPDASLADLYDELTMPPELRKAHQRNDRAVMEAYGFWGKLNSEPECVAELMKMYQKLIASI